MSPKDDYTPVLRVDLKRADAAELVLQDVELKDCAFVRALGARALDVLKQGVARRYHDRVVVFHTGDEGGSLFFVINGEVRLFARREADGVELKPVRRGGVLGEAEVLGAGSKRSASAVAHGHVDIVELGREALLVGGQLPPPLRAYLEAVRGDRARALDELADFLNRW